jgi:hypothetical protein
MGYHASGPDAAENTHFTEELDEEPQSAAAVSAQVLSENMSLGDSITVESESKHIPAESAIASQLILYIHPRSSRTVCARSADQCWNPGKRDTSRHSR